MTRDEIISMALEAGMERVIDVHKDGTRTIELTHPDLLKRFAELVAAAEREKLNNGRCIACGNHITEGGGQVVPTLEGSNGQA